MIFQCRRRSIQVPEAARPLHIAPQPVLETSVTTMPVETKDPSKAELASLQVQPWKDSCVDSCVMAMQCLPQHHAHFGFGHEASAEVVLFALTQVA